MPNRARVRGTENQWEGVPGEFKGGWVIEASGFEVVERVNFVCHDQKALLRERERKECT